MKTRSLLMSFFCLITFAVVAQGVENDDMYFNSRDRAKLRAEQEKELTYASASTGNKYDRDYDKDVTNQYSARDVNPEYTSRKNSQTAQTDNQDYYVNNYQYNKANNYNNFNSSYTNWYNSSWYNSSWYGPSMYSCNSPYYGGYYSNSMMYDPFYSSYYGYNPYSYYGYGSSFGYGFGSGFGMSFGYYNNPYYNSYYSGGWGSSFWSNSYYYPSTVVVINNNSGGRNVVQGSRPSRSGMSLYSNNDYYGSGSSSTRSNAAIQSGRGRDDGSISSGSNSGGRVATSQSTSANQPQSDYYNRGWRTQQTQPANTAPSPSHNYSNNNTNSGWGNNNTYSPPTTPSNSNSNPFGGQRGGGSFDNSRSGSFSAPSHSSGGGGGNGGGGHSRGR